MHYNHLSAQRHDSPRYYQLRLEQRRQLTGAGSEDQSWETDRKAVRGTWQ
eukprot:SAG31_NODE_34671_length_330_cov_1.333333_1_plen_49_part_10